MVTLIKSKCFFLCFLWILLLATKSNAFGVISDGLESRQMELSQLKELTGSNSNSTETTTKIQKFYSPILDKLFYYYSRVSKVILFSLLGVVIEMPKVQVALKRPIGPCIASAGNWIFAPLVSQ